MDELPESILALQRLERIARRRHGIFRRDHVVTSGMSNGAFGRLRRRGLAHQVHRRTFALGSPPMTDRARWLAACDAYGPGAVLIGDAAAALWSVSKRRTKVIAVLVPGRRSRVPGTVMRRTRLLPPNDITKVDNVPVATVERLLIELAADGRDVDELCSIIDEAAFRRVLDVETLRLQLVRHRFRPGHGRLAEALERYEHGDGGTKSEFESRVLRRIKRVLSVPYECNRRRIIGGRRMKPDILVPSLKIAIEVDGGGHRRPTRVRDDARRDEAYECSGITLVRVREASENADIERAVRLIEQRQADMRSAQARQARVRS